MKGVLSKIDTAVLDKLIVGRVEPYIYAFSTETVPNYLKVGDTSRSVRVRLDEWRKIFPNLIQQYEHSAQIDSETIFRDFAVHSFLEQEKGRERLQPHTFENIPYYSREFFKDATPEDVEAAIKDIIQSSRKRSGKYPLYSIDRLPQTYTYARTEDFIPRDNQQKAIDTFKAAVEAGRTNLLLYAVMRFGKSFTAMCCAKEINARFVVIVSAKADVKEEWKKTVESHKFFEDYHFLDSEALKRDETIIATALANSNKKIALFLTLQDLQGDEIKDKHKEVFDRKIDLLIIDETHFGARGESYGKVLQEQRFSKSEIKKELKNLEGFETLDYVEDAVKTFDAKIRLHLSGTPYRILMSEEFQREDIVAFVQFTDITEAQQKWNDEHLKEDDSEEWKNPYFGFPQMIRFAFTPNDSSRKKMEQLRKEGATYALSELLRPLSVSYQKDGSHRKFKHEAEILDLLEVIDGTKEDENLLGFLDYDKIKDGKMCRHIVCVLPFRASCDAMSDLIRRERKRFKNLGDYEIINIAGFDDERKYESTGDVKRTIQENESQNKKTLTLTVNRMMTGTTVPQWDTMLYLKGTASPQEYDQAIFRLQNQYIKTFKDESGNTIKYNMKPQTLLVDFDPNRMFVLQELKSQFYNVNKEANGNSLLRERIAKELEVSPIIVVNKNKLQQATPTNITDAVRAYARTRSILEDATDILTDNELLKDNSLATILSTIEPIDSKNGLKIKPTEGDGEEITTPENTEPKVQNDDYDKNNRPSSSKQNEESIETDSLNKRLEAFYARILFFAFLTESTVKSLTDIIRQMSATEDNRRIAHNLGLCTKILNLIQRKSNPFVLQKLDYKIENINELMQDEHLSPIKRVEIAMRKFGRMSDSEIVTPLNVADNVVNLLPDNVISKGPILDIASKQGEFSISLLKRYGQEASDMIYSVCTSVLAYEFTRKVYKLLSLPIDHIFNSFTSYDLIEKDENNKYIIPKAIKDMNFAAIIGNPPYQDRGGSGGTNDAPIFQHFCNVASALKPSNVSMIIPAKWFAGGRDSLLGEFRTTMLTSGHVKKLVAFTSSRELFPSVEIKGGVCYFLLEDRINEVCEYSLHNGGVVISEKRNLAVNEILIRDPQLSKLVAKIKEFHSGSFVDSLISADTPFGIPTNPEANKDIRDYLSSKKDRSHPIELHYLSKLKRVSSFIPKKIITKNLNDMNKPKVYIPKAGGSGNDTKVLSDPILSIKPSVCSQTYVYASFDSPKEAVAFEKYIRTKFFRILVSAAKVTQDALSKVYRFVPLQDFTANSDIDWSKSVDEIDNQLYAKYNLSNSEITFIESMIKPM